MACGSKSISSVLEEARQRMEREEERQWVERRYHFSSSKVQPVPRPFKGDKYTKYCRPKVISIGPIHHDDPELKPGEQYKLIWASMFAERYGQNPDDLHKRVLDNIADLRKLFSWDEIGKAYNDEDLAFMLFVDGCSIIQILENSLLSRPHEPIIMKVDQLLLVQRDLLLLENQLPYQVLQLLVDEEMQLKFFMRRFCELHNMFKVIGSMQRSPFLGERMENTSPPAHLLDCLYKTILINYIDTEEAEGQVTSRPVNSFHEEEIKGLSIRKLKAYAFQIKREENDLSLSVLSSRGFFFDTPIVYVSPLILDDSTIPILLNLIAYERCPNFTNALLINSFIKFFHLLIVDLEDVKELTKDGILQSSLGSDKEVAEFFNTIGPDLEQKHSVFPCLKSAMELQHKSKFKIRMAKAYYKNKCRIWMAEAYDTHCKSPWTIIALVAATTLLILTFIQTVNSF